jgi:uncharacterized protein (DUF1697 family)
MPAYVALLRGIMPANPKHRNEDLRRIFEEVGFTNVRTVIASGNVLFESSDRSITKIEHKIEAALEVHMGKRCATIVRSRKQIDELAALDVFDEFADLRSSACNVTFLKRPPAKLPALTSNEIASVIGYHAGALLTVDHEPATPALMRETERVLGKDITTRTWKTVHRIKAAFDKG